MIETAFDYLEPILHLFWCQWGLLWTWSVMNRSVMNAVCFKWSVMNRSFLNGHLKGLFYSGNEVKRK